MFYEMADGQKRLLLSYQDLEKNGAVEFYPLQDHKRFVLGDLERNAKAQGKDVDWLFRKKRDLTRKYEDIEYEFGGLIGK